MSDIKWDGEGIPPVGTVCEYKLNESRPWFECEIKYVLEGVSDDEKCFVAWCPHLGTDQLLSFGSEDYQLYLRQLKTPEQIEAEERENVLADMYGAVMGSAGIAGGLEALYDAGYRKVEVKK